jgi:predicted HTH domain antitoxin
MTLHPLATRVPKEIEQEIREVMDYLKVDKAQAVRIILEIGISEWRKRTAIELLRDGKVTFAKAAKLAKLDLWELADEVKDKKVEWVKISTGELGEEVKKAAKDTVE